MDTASFYSAAALQPYTANNEDQQRQQQRLAGIEAASSYSAVALWPSTASINNQQHLTGIDPACSHILQSICQSSCQGFWCRLSRPPWKTGGKKTRTLAKTAKKSTTAAMPCWDWIAGQPMTLSSNDHQPTRTDPTKVRGNFWRYLVSVVWRWRIRKKINKHDNHTTSMILVNECAVNPTDHRPTHDD